MVSKPQNQSPLFVACEKGHFEIVKELLKHQKIDTNNGVSIISPFYGFLTSKSVCKYSFSILWCLNLKIRM
ncbi:hypothetical protein [Neptuniibacter sp.]|uniref:hypothetical protein n=1 Tax=Neptuniibacter sp. TaxID=1962643 RepID=UPI003378CDB9|nr:ankyrin repeat domain-containing protein [Neptuniibacter sp.]